MSEISLSKPIVKPARPFFSSGPCAKRPGWSLAALEGALLGRSHRAPEGRARLKAVIERSKAILGLPADWRLGIVPASDTGAVEMSLWALCGERGVDVLSFESFSGEWARDLREVLALPDLRVHEARYGALPDLSVVDWSRDVVLTWNGTTSGVRMPGPEAIPATHEGLVICDATSAAFAMDLPWDRLDVVTWSWQKVLGGEAAHGMLALSPRAAVRLAQPSPRPLPKIFRLANGKGLIEGVFAGDTINTPSMLCVEDALDGLNWAASIGGLPALKARSAANLAAVERWAARAGWVDFLADSPEIRSSTSICLRIVAPWFLALSAEGMDRAVKHLTGLVAAEGAGFDLASYRDAPPGLRLWGGATVDTADIEALLPWLDWAHEVTRLEFAA
ncbi:phosphoserine transaminase [Acidomonas methanolica]|uniref:Phosphoserine aminotransferase n=2 Tax=Acidomonas methanolica TaxID=437 RepID=A0A023D655_ACIMT|nr:phosphoserine transaminase [Acidomonas methanolica]MBU2655480.1 phosphoserine transaminase [Acidomonas methanolica]TCS21736.1 phosphoserine aminotransferase [Acidomonas methanolica]GAJ29648.1 phosphoserine aminotransferase [Acidomonas methanolica NBRC 104435]GEL00326.1 phosphoserine aminotransferase [Acidomonas methanolica NBRC 104435]